MIIVKNNNAIVDIRHGGTAATNANDALANLGATASKVMTKAEYEALSTKEENVLYVISDDETDSADVIAHINNKSNPHGVTADQIGAATTTAVSNALKEAKSYTDSKTAGISADIFATGTTAPSNTKLLWIDTTTNTGGLKYYNGSKWVHVPVAYT